MGTSSYLAGCLALAACHVADWKDARSKELVVGMAHLPIPAGWRDIDELVNRDQLHELLANLPQEMVVIANEDRRQRIGISYQLATSGGITTALHACAFKPGQMRNPWGPGYTQFLRNEPAMHGGETGCEVALELHGPETTQARTIFELEHGDYELTIICESDEPACKQVFETIVLPR